VGKKQKLIRIEDLSPGEKKDLSLPTRKTDITLLEGRFDGRPQPYVSGKSKAKEPRRAALLQLA